MDLAAQPVVGGGMGPGGHARPGPRDGIRRQVGKRGGAVEREFGRKVEGDVAGEQAAADERVLAAVELAADGLVVGVTIAAIAVVPYIRPIWAPSNLSVCPRYVPRVTAQLPQMKYWRNIMIWSRRRVLT